MPLINKKTVFIALLGAFFSYSVSAESLFSSVHIQNLPNLSIDTLGVENDMPASIWEKSDVASLERLVREIVSKPLTPAMQDTIAEMMVRQTSQEAVLPLIFRMEILMHLGRFTEVLTLVDLVPLVHQTPDVLKLKAQALFLSGQTQQACDLMVKMPELTQMAEDMRLACAVAKKDKTGAELIFATRSENNELDKVSMALAKKVFLNDELSFDAKEIKAHHLHLLALASNGVDWNKISLPIAYQKKVSDLPEIPLHIRIDMADRTNVAKLDELYTQVDDKTEKNNAVLRAKLYQKMKSIKDEVKLAGIVNEYLELARTDGLFLNLAPIIRPVLDTISPSDKTKEIAFNAVQVYALSDNADLAYPWYQILQKSTDNTFKMQGIFLEPVIQQLGGGIPQSVDKGLLFCAQNDNPYCVSYLNKIGNDIEVGNWSDVLNHMPSSHRYMSLVQTALRGLITSGRQGEAILYALKLCQASSETEPDMIMVLSEIMPKTVTRRLILERYVYP